MSFGPRARRARPHGAWLVLFLGLAILLPCRAEAQGVQPQPGDTVPQDTVLVPGVADVEPGDTVPAAVAAAAESSGVVPPIVQVPRPMAAGWASARWVLDTGDVGLEPGITLLEILERLPGFARFRPGGYGRPEGVTAIGLGGSRLQVIVDGREMLPFGAGAFELESIQLLDIETLEVERTPAGIRVEVTTFRLGQPDAHSVVELGTGVYQTRLLRALFSRGFGTRSAGTGGFDLVTTRGSGIREPYSHSSAVFRYAYAPTDATTIQAEWRRTAIDREGDLYVRQTTRSDLSLFGRAELSDDLVVEAIVARTRQDEDAEEARQYDAGTIDGVLRGVYGSDAVGAEAVLRVRSLDDAVPPAPTVEGEGRVALSPLRIVRVEGSARHATGDDASATTISATGVVSPIPAISAFASLHAGERLVARVGAGADGLTGELFPAGASGWRGGFELNTEPLHVGVAAFQSGATIIAPFGLGFDRGIPPVEAAALSGFEASFAAPIPGTRGALSVEGWYVRMPDALDRPYAPLELARGGIRFHGLYYGGQLEPLIRVEGVHRGQARGPELGVGTGFDAIAPAYQTLHLSLQLRIIDVQAFFLWDNLLVNRSAVDLVGDPQAFPRIVYGAEWRFRG